MTRPPSLLRRLNTLIAILAITLTAMLTLFAVQSAGKQVRADQGALLSSVANRLARQLDQSLAERWVDIQVLAEVGLVVAEDSPAERVRAELQSLAAAIPEYAWIGFAGSDGKVRVATGGLLEGADVSERPWFANAKESPYIGDLHEALLLEKLLGEPGQEALRFVDVSAPVFHPDGTLKGVLGAHLYSRWASDLIDALLETREQEQPIQVIVLNSNSEVIYGPAAYRGTTPRLESAQGEGVAYVEEAWVDGKPGFTAYAVAEGFRDFPGLNWRVLVHRNRAAVLAPVRELQLRMTLTGTAIGLMLLLFSAFQARRIARPLRDLAERIRGTDWVGELSDLEPPDDYREVYDLSTTLQQMVVKMQSDEFELERQRRRDLERINTIRELHSSANTDVLTGVDNRRAFDQRIQRVMESLAKYPKPVSLIVFDLDHFKQINDEQGHGAGDAVLIAVARAVKQQLRDEDCVARIGGEEFAVLLPETSIGLAELLAERLRKAIAELEVRVGDTVIRPTASMGVATIDGQTATGANSLLETADIAMYQAKEAGRNRVVTAPVKQPETSSNNP